MDERNRGVFRKIYGGMNMKKILCFILFCLFSIRVCAGNAASKYFAQYVSYTTPQGVSKKSIREIIELKNNEIIFYSHKRCRKYLFSWNDDCLEYKKGKNTFRIFYDSSTNELYTKKPGKWFFIPKKIVYRPLAAETASKRIKQWQ